MLKRNVLLLSCIVLFSFTPSCVFCQRNSTTQTGESDLQKIREIMAQGKLPPEDIVIKVERESANTKIGALATLLRSYILLENGNPTLAADILNTKNISQKTDLEDYRLWLRGKALKQAGLLNEAISTLEVLIKNYPRSSRAEESKLIISEAAIQTNNPQLAISVIQDLIEQKHPKALLLAAQSYELRGDENSALEFYRLTTIYAAGSTEAREAESHLKSSALTVLKNQKEAITKADKLFESKKFVEAISAYDQASTFGELPPEAKLKKLEALVKLKKLAEARAFLNSIPPAQKEKAYYILSISFASDRQWAEARSFAEQMLKEFPKSKLTLRGLVELGFKARDAKNKSEQRYYFQLAVKNFPDDIEVAKAQFELAWLEHESKNYNVSSKMLIEHLAKYADRDNSYRGRAGYWAARDAEQVGIFDNACLLYQALIYRYHANWYGYLAIQRLDNLRKLGKCTDKSAPSNPTLTKAIENLKTVNVFAETITPTEEKLIKRAEELATIGLFSWASDEFQEASKSAPKSPKLNLSIARILRSKGDYVGALLALANSYPDYPQMFPEEMGQEQWSIFYPLEHWDKIKFWSQQRNLDPYQVAGLIRQESVFNPRAKSPANAYGLMQLLIPTAQTLSAKCPINTQVNEETLYQPELNICLGTAYLKNMLDRFGRIEYAAAAYNAGPSRVAKWRNTLPIELDEFVEAIPFNETRGYVQGVIRNTAQYRRLYDENGNFRPNVGSKLTRERIVEINTNDEMVAATN